MESIGRIGIVIALACFGFSAGAEGANVPFVRGNPNADARIDIADAITVLEYLFLSKPIPCPAAANSNGDGSLDIGDAIYLLNYLFVDGPAPPPPFPDCGPESIVGVQFPCDSFPPCAVVQPDPPTDLTCAPGPGELEVSLAWTNGDAYDEVEILRDGVSIAKIPVVSSYRDDVPAPGTYAYAVLGRVGDLASAASSPCEATATVIVAAVADLACAAVSDTLQVDLSWTNPETYAEIEIRRDGAPIYRGASIVAHRDATAGPGPHAYEVIAYRHGVASAPASCAVTVIVPPPRGLACAQRPAALAVDLAWQNPLTYDAIQLFRNGSLVATLAGDATSRADPVPAYGDYAYQGIGIVSGVASEPATCSLRVGPAGPTDLACTDVDLRQGTNPLQVRQVPCILLSWTNPQAFDGIRILRDGLPIAELPGATEEYLDLVPAAGTYAYDVLAIADGVPTASARCTIESAPRTEGDLWATLRFDVERRLTAADPATNVWVRAGIPVLSNGWQLSILWDPGLVFEHCEDDLGEGPPYNLRGTCYEEGVDFDGFAPDFYYKQYRETSVTVGVIMDTAFQQILSPDPDRPLFRLRFRADPFVAGAVYRLRYEPTVTPNGATLDNNVTGRIPTEEPPYARWSNLWPLYLYFGEIRAE